MIRVLYQKNYRSTMQIGFQERDNINKRETKEKKLGFL